MLMSVIGSAIILVAILFISNRDIAIGPLLLIPVIAFVAGFYWSRRRSARPKVPPKPPATITIILKSSAVGIAAMVLSVIAYFVWIWIRIPRHPHTLVAIDVHALLYWPVLLVGFLAGFFSQYRRGSKRRSQLTGGMAQ